VFGARVETPIDAALLARTILKELLEGLYEGSGSCLGLPALRAGSFVQIRGIGKRFSGTYRLRKVTHAIGANGYRTSFEVTQRSSSTILSAFRRYLDETPPPSAPRRFDGVMVATVTGASELRSVPPEVPLGRVKLKFPWLSDSSESAWARIATPDGGMYFRPSEGEEVLVAFENGDLSKPVVLGTLWNVEHLPPEQNVDGTNRVRLIKSPSGHTIKFDDTPGLGTLVIEHNKGGSVTFGPDGSVTISSPRNLTLQAAGSITLSATSVDVV
jgi:uncharacterized protein involved in type VI secretion and phage assembly